MPAIVPAQWGPWLVVKHAVSQGYVIYIDRRQTSPWALDQWIPIPVVDMTITLDEPSTVVQLFRGTVMEAEQLELRLRCGAQVSVHQTHETWNGGTSFVDYSGVMLVRPWDLPAGSHTFGLEGRTRYPVTQFWRPYISEMRHVLAVLKR